MYVAMGLLLVSIAVVWPFLYLLHPSSSAAYQRYVRSMRSTAPADPVAVSAPDLRWYLAWTVGRFPDGRRVDVHPSGFDPLWWNAVLEVGRLTQDEDAVKQAFAGLEIGQLFREAGLIHGYPKPPPERLPELHARIDRLLGVTCRE
jgi:hypothetical protein